MNRLLIVVDMQNDFITGSLGNKQARAIVPNVVTKIQRYLNNDNGIIFTRDTHYDNYLNTSEGRALPVVHCVKDTWGWQIHDDILHTMTKPFITINKSTFGYDSWNYIDDSMHDYEEIELVGLCTDICVVTNALLLKTHFPEIIITVDASCCAGTSQVAHEAALTVMKSCQINVINET